MVVKIFKQRPIFQCYDSCLKSCRNMQIKYQERFVLRNSRLRAMETNGRKLGDETVRVSIRTTIE